jgi:transcriptional regulator with XRE-family HTH domain
MIESLQGRFGANVRIARIALNMSQDDLSEIAGLFRTYISRIENGNANPTVSVIVALAQALSCEPWELLQ